MRKLILIVAMVGALAFGAVAQNTLSLTNPVPQAPVKEYFTANEWTLGLSTTYTLGSSASTAFRNKYALNLGADAQYYFTKWTALEASLPFYQNQGASLSEAYGGLAARLPLSTKWSLLNHAAPYVAVDYAYNWHTAASSYIGRAGLEVRVIKRVGLFAEYDYRDTKLDLKGASSLRGGFRLNW